MARHASELENSPLFLQEAQHDAPVSVGMGHLMTKDGKQLEQMTRVSSPTMVNAMMIGNIYANIYGSKYVRSRIEQIERIAEARDGLRAQEIIQVIDAGGKLPAEYYTGQGGDRSVRPVGGPE